MTDSNRFKQRCITMAVLQALAAQASMATTITVDSVLDTIAADGNCTLREAITTANSDQPIADCAQGNLNDTIEFNLAPSSTITLTSSEQLPTITSNITVNGLGRDDLEISGNNTSRIFYLKSSSASLTLNDLTLTYGRTYHRTLPDNFDDPIYSGGAILAVEDSNLTINRSSISKSDARIFGGAIFADEGTNVTITASTISDSSASGGGGGIAMVGDSTLIFDNSVITGNDAERGNGGGIFARGNNLDASPLFQTKPTVTIRESSVSDNRGAYGAGINVTGAETITLTNSTVAGNGFQGTSESDVRNSRNGGGIYANGATMTIINSTVSNNLAAVYGGGIHLGRGSLSNDIGGSRLQIFTSTVTGNSVFNATNLGFSVLGGGIFGNTDSDLDVYSSIISGNSVNSSAIGKGNEIASVSADVRSLNSVIGDASQSGAEAVDSPLAFISALDNIFATSDSSQPTALDGILFSLDDNGGPTQTHALVVGSPAENAAIDIVCSFNQIEGRDQRGVSRPATGCDIGAFEGALEPPVTDSDSNFIVVPLPNGKSVIFDL